jgi:hypothetical protein
MNLAMTPINAALRLLAVPATPLFLSLQLHALPLRVLAWDSEIAAMRLGLVDAKGSVEIESMHPSKRTPAYPLTAGEKPAALEIRDLKGPDGKPLTMEIKMPAAIRQPLLVILPDQKAATGLRLFVLEDDVGNFAWGSTRFINATGRKLFFGYEKKLVALPPSWDPAQTEPGGDARNMEVKFFFADQPSRPFYSGVWEQNPELRMLVFLVPGEDPRLGPVAMKMIPEDRRLLNAAAEAR